MTDNKLTLEEVIKALECCTPTNESCLNCPLIDVSVPECAGILYKATIDLINRQQAELDDLKRDTIPKLQEGLKRANKYGLEIDKENEQLKAEIERLNSDLRVWKDISHRETAYVETAKFETIKNYLETCEKTATSNAAKAAKAKFLEMVGEDK